MFLEDRPNDDAYYYTYVICLKSNYDANVVSLQKIWQTSFNLLSRVQRNKGIVDFVKSRMKPEVIATD